MCQITLVNLHNVELNRKLLLILGSVGSPVHDDGWGFSDNNGKIWKCSLPMHLTSDAGDIIRKGLKSGKISIGHIRQASSMIPVTPANSHPFVQDGISFVHNGKLTPNDEKKFVMETDVEEVDDKGVTRIKKIKRSDSKIFFETFMTHWNEFTEEVSEPDKFLKVFQDTMDLFYGKFAMVFVINRHTYICRGKTAELNISYMLEKPEKDAKILGWAINTDKSTLDVSTGLLSNLEQLEGRNPVYFTIPSLLEEDSVYVATDSGVRKIGEVKENSYKYAGSNTNSTNYHQPNSWNREDFSNPTTGDTGGIKPKKTDVKLRKLYDQIYKFMDGYSLSPIDIQILFFVCYQASLLEVTEEMLVHFCRYVIPTLAGNSNKEIRLALRKTLAGYQVSHYRYKNTDYKYPWMLNDLKSQMKFVKDIEAKK